MGSLLDMGVSKVWGSESGGSLELGVVMGGSLEPWGMEEGVFSVWNDGGVGCPLPSWGMETGSLLWGMRVGVSAVPEGLQSMGW